MSAILADFTAYSWDLVSSWAALFWAATLIPDGLSVVLKRKHMERLDAMIGGEERRILIFRSLFVVGLLAASFVAWQEQYDRAKNVPRLRQQLTEFSQTNAKLQLESGTLHVALDLANKERAEEHDRAESYKQQLQANQPELRAQLPLPPIVIRGPHPDYRTTIFVLMMVLNKSAHPLSITNYALTLDTAAGKFEFPAQLMPAPNTTDPSERALLDALHSVQLSNVKVTNESLIEDTQHPMMEGHRAIGYLMFRTPDDIYDKLTEGKGSMTIRFVDSKDQPHEEKFEYDHAVRENSGLLCPVL